MDLLYRSVGDTLPTRGVGPAGRTGIMMTARRARMGAAGPEDMGPPAGVKVKDQLPGEAILLP